MVSRQTVNQWENDQTQPNIDNLVRLKEIFGVSVDKMLDTEEDKKPSINKDSLDTLCAALAYAMGIEPPACAQEKNAELVNYIDKVFDGESRDEFCERIKGFMKLLESQNYENVAFFSHAGFLRTFVDIVLGTVISRKALCCGNCTVAVFECTNGDWKLHSWINLN